MQSTEYCICYAQIPQHYTVMVPGGQCRTQSMTGDMTAQLIKVAAIRPDERMKFLVGKSLCIQFDSVYLFGYLFLMSL